MEEYIYKRRDSEVIDKKVIFLNKGQNLTIVQENSSESNTEARHTFLDYSAIS